MLRTSDENSTRGHSSSPEQQGHLQLSDVGDEHECTKSRITEHERAQIWAVLSKETSKTSIGSAEGRGASGANTTGFRRSAPTATTTTTTMKVEFGDAGSDPTKQLHRRDSRTKRIGEAFKRIFMNDQTVVRGGSTHHRRDSWDDIYRNKDASKIRPIHEEYGIL